MMTHGAISEAVETMRKHQTVKNQKMSVLNAEVERLQNDKSLHPDFVVNKIAETRDKHLPAIRDAVNASQALHDTLLKQTPFVQSKEYYLSTKPLTKPLNSIPGAPAADEHLEQTARLSKMQELSKMSNELLHLTVADAKSNKQYGLIHLAVQENSARKDSQPIDLTDVVLEDQEQAKALLKESSLIQSNMHLSFREALGHNVSGIDRLNAARGLTPGGAGSATLPGSLTDRLTASRAGA